MNESPLTRATTLLPETNRPNSREMIATVAPQPLYITVYQPTLCSHLIVKGVSKADPAPLPKRLARETINTCPRTTAHEHTDDPIPRQNVHIH